MHDADLFRGVYREAYHEIVQPGRVWTAGKYFLRRWSAYLSPPEMWLVIGARQLSYLNRRRPWFTAYDNTLAGAAGLNVDVYRRTLKRAIAEQEGAIAHFLKKQADPHYVLRDARPRKGRTRYTVRLDDPLTPADAAALARWLQTRLSANAGEQELVAVLEEARQLEAQRLWAKTLDAAQQDAAAEAPAEPLLTVADVVLSLLPHLAQDAVSGKAWRAAAGALHTHIIAGERVHLEPQYFREKWLPQLGAGPALLLIALRSLCYYNEESGEIRDVVRVEANALAQQLQTTTRTLRRWFKKLEQAAAHDALFGPFFTFLESVKQPDQTVLSVYRVNPKMPLTAADLLRYQQRAAGRPQHAAEPHAGNGHNDANGVADKRSVTYRRVTDKKSATNGAAAGSANGLPDKKSVTKGAARDPVADKKSVAQAGAGQKVGNGTAGNGQKVGASQTKGRPYKHYERLLTLLNLQSINQLEQNTEQQYQHLWRMHEQKALQPFADVVVADSSLLDFMEQLGIQEPTRSRIAQRLAPGNAPATVVGWWLYAQQQANLDQPLAYVVSRLLAADQPPPPYAELAQMSWEQWRAYAALAALASGPLSEPLTAAPDPQFDQWLALYGRTPAENLPFAVGLGLPTPPPYPPPHASAPPPTPKNADAALWQETLAELALQMTQSTFDAWLRQSRFLQRQDQTWTIAVINQAACSWLENRLYHIIQRTLATVVGSDVVVQFVVDGGD